MFEGWHLEKRVTVGHILTTVSAFGSLAYFLATQDTRIAVLEHKVDANEQRMERDIGEIKGMLIRIEDKMDRKADKGLE